MKINEKEKLRDIFKEKRKQISQERREKIEKQLIERLYPKLIEHKYILSFASFGYEINLWSLNTILCEEGRLLLPRVEGSHLKIYHVNNLKELVQSKMGILEPDPTVSVLFDKKKITCALIPALAFDSHNHRLGYGKGHIDKMLSDIDNCITIGVGFKEQHMNDLLPIEEHDQKLTSLMLF